MNIINKSKDCTVYEFKQLNKISAEFEKDNYDLEWQKYVTSGLNKTKNRWSDVYPTNKKTTVYLKNGDYINANWTFDSKLKYPQKYILTQAPLKSTIGDFWTMVWENKIHIIIMLTKFIENRVYKADLYFPDKINKILEYCGLSIKLVNVSYKNKIIIRFF